MTAGIRLLGEELKAFCDWQSATGRMRRSGRRALALREDEQMRRVFTKLTSVGEKKRREVEMKDGWAQSGWRINCLDCSYLFT